MNPTPGPWLISETPGGELKICARVNIGRDMSQGELQPLYEVSITPQLSVGTDGKVYATISYDSYRQFPSNDFIEMQRANARLMSQAPEMRLLLLHLFEEYADSWTEEEHRQTEDALNRIAG